VTNPVPMSAINSCFANKAYIHDNLTTKIEQVLYCTV